MQAIAQTTMNWRFSRSREGLRGRNVYDWAASRAGV